MIQAARSGKQNIIEGSMAAATSKETEIKLTNVARASLENCWPITGIFCAAHKYEEWSKDHRYAQRLRQLNRFPNATYDTFKRASSMRTRLFAPMSSSA